MREIEVWPGDLITVVAARTVEATHFTGEDAAFTFNETRIVATPAQGAEDVVRAYLVARGDDPDSAG